MVLCMCYVYEKSFKITSTIDYPNRKFLRVIFTIIDQRAQHLDANTGSRCLFGIQILKKRSVFVSVLFL